VSAATTDAKTDTDSGINPTAAFDLHGFMAGLISRRVTPGPFIMNGFDLVD